MGDYTVSLSQRKITNMKSFLVVPLLASVCLGAPYGAPAPPPTTVQPQPAKIIEQKPELVCATHYTTIWDTEYKVEVMQECKTHYEKECKLENERLCQETTREECKTVKDQVCETVYKKVCEYQWVVQGNNKVWAPIQSTCKKNPYDECKDVEKTHEKLVAYPVCKDVPEQKCHYVDREECYQVPDKVCKTQQLKKCVDIPKEVCHVSHKKIPVRVSKSVPKKVCNSHVVKDLVGEAVAAVTVPSVVPEEVTEPANTIITRRDPSSIEFGEDKENIAEDKEESTKEKLVFSI